MLFNSIDFAIFLPVVFLLYWFVVNKNLRTQNFLIVAASYLFYGWWDWRFLSLIFISSIIDYSVGLGIVRQDSKKKKSLLLWVSILTNLGFLGFFKYYNFFLDNFITAFSFFGTEFKFESLRIILPVGISFYTFQTLSYSIDVYREKLKPTRDFIAFSAFVSFFPQLVAGPIERATNLLPQFYEKRTFDYQKATDGLRQILWGLFKKIVIADSCAILVNRVFNNQEAYSGSSILIAAILFAFQIYCDFSGYSDIAIGTARLFGFNLMRNFAFPYFSRDIAEFWRRWHISLSTWFRDYLYIPIGGSQGGTLKKVRNTFVIFIVSGFWHGANWTFIIWGFLNAVYFLPLLLSKANRNHLDVVAQGKSLPSLREAVSIMLTFGLTLIAWVFFRANSAGHAMQLLNKIFSLSLFRIPELEVPIYLPLLIIFLIVAEWLAREWQYALEKINVGWSKPVRWGLYAILVFVILGFSGNEQDFIYFQF